MLANAHATVALADRGIRSSVVRLPPTVHGDGDHGFLATLVAIAREKGVSGYIRDGANRWPAVHRSDAAHLFRLALESAPAGSTLHAVADEGVPIRTVAEVIGRHLRTSHPQIRMSRRKLLKLRREHRSDDVHLRAGLDERRDFARCDASTTRNQRGDRRSLEHERIPAHRN